MDKGCAPLPNLTCCRYSRKEEGEEEEEEQVEGEETVFSSSLDMGTWYQEFES